ncbi:hypothetical protein FQN54_007491 [Arachnomyces sp. PD_36]|nr:hypothetical protein FQN54_007491 [Arachnomyces sp. PD_36]
MLDWISGAPRGDYMDSADDSKLPEPPETPGPVFALRAFKSAIFGTPGIEEEYTDDRFSRPTRPDNYHPQSNEVTERANGNLKLEDSKEPDLKPKPERNLPPMGSPTKSILLTPGTAVTRRKTVSFGDAVVKNEQKNPAPGGNTDKTQPKVGAITSQWNSRRPTPGRKPRSKLTQSLLDAREPKSSEEEESLTPEHKKPECNAGPSKATAEVDSEEPMEDDGDETINLNEPRSQSGQYWKSEFENYRARTDREIRKLIQYRSVAKSYARKKDLEALRLSEKLKAEEAKVAEVERKVSELASGMVGGAEGGDIDREEVVKDLVNQTALALQYKQKVSALRKTLERHGVVVSDDEADKDGDNPSGEVHRSAHPKTGATASQDKDMEELRHLASSSEKKAAELEKENLALKKNMLRVKEEMGKYEERRKAKEARLKQREQKLETRNQEYRERLSVASKERRDAEDALKSSFNDERKEMTAQIESLRSQLATAEKVSSTSKLEKGRSEKPSRDRLAKPDRDERLAMDGRRVSNKALIEPEIPGGLEKNTQSHRHRRESHQQSGSRLKSRRSHSGSKDIGIWATQGDSTSKNHDVAKLEQPTTEEGKQEVLADDNTYGELYKHHTSDHDQTGIPPSSPPQLPSPEASLIEFTPPAKAEAQPPRQYHQPKIHAFQSPRPSIVPFQPAPTNLDEENDYQSENLHTQQNPATKVSKRPSAVALDRDAHHVPSMSVPDRSLLLSSTGKGTAAARKNGISAERLAAASSRLQSKKSSGGAASRSMVISGGKENTHPAYR